MGSDPAQWFEIEMETGIVKLISAMDRESEFVKDNIYTATVLAYDDGESPQIYMATFCNSLAAFTNH